MLVFIFIKKKIVLSFDPPDSNPDSISVNKYNQALKIVGEDAIRC